MWCGRRKSHSSAGQTDFISDISTAEVPWGRGEGIHVWTDPLLLSLLDPTKMGPGLEEFLLLHLKCGDGGREGLALLPVAPVINPVLSLPRRD